MARSAAELITAIAEVDAAISATLKGQSFSMDTGQGKQSVTRASLADLREMRNELQAELDGVTDTTGGVMTGTFQRW